MDMQQIKKICRDSFVQRAFANEVMLGCRQYLSFKDTKTLPPYVRNAPGVTSHKICAGKISDLPGYHKEEQTFCNLCGLSSIISKEEFAKLLHLYTTGSSTGSSLVFDYCNMSFDENDVLYTYTEVEKLMGQNNFLIYEHIDSNQATVQFLSEHNKLYPQNKLALMPGINYVLAVKRR